MTRPESPRDFSSSNASHLVEAGTATDRTEADLLRLAREDADSPAGRRAASELLSRYQDHVYAWCFRYVREHERALDLAQDVLLAAYRNLGSFGERAQFGSWLFAIARNRCISELRRPGIELDAETDPDHLQGERDPLQELLDRQGEQKLLELIKRHLDRREQKVLWLRCVDRMPLDVITKVVRIKQASGARTVLQRARRKLRTALEVEATA